MAEGFKFVGVADDVADEGVVWRQEFVVVQWFSCADCSVFRAVGYILDDLFEFRVIADVFVAELVESLFEGPFLVVVFVVSDVVWPSRGHRVQNQVAILSAIVVVLTHDVDGHLGDFLHVFVSVRFVSVSTCCLDESREHVPACSGGGVHCVVLVSCVCAKAT